MFLASLRYYSKCIPTMDQINVISVIALDESICSRFCRRRMVVRRSKLGKCRENRALYILSDRVLSSSSYPTCTRSNEQVSLHLVSHCRGENGRQVDLRSADRKKDFHPGSQVYSFLLSSRVWAKAGNNVPLASASPIACHSVCCFSLPFFPFFVFFFPLFFTERLIKGLMDF